MRRRSVVLAVLVLAAAPFAGCGGAITPDELSRSIGTLESTAAEGAFLAKDVAGDRTKATFARAHAHDLGAVVDHEAEKLNDAEADQADVAAAKSDAVNLADRIGSALGQIQIAPGDEAGGRKAEQALNRLSEDAGKLADAL
jgi:hypothetical protein